MERAVSAVSEAMMSGALMPRRCALVTRLLTMPGPKVSRPVDLGGRRLK